MKTRTLVFGCLALWFPIAALGQPAEEEADTGSGIYRTTDKDGNVIFTDSPPEDRPAEEIEVSPGNRLPLPKVSLPSAPKDEEASPGYRSLTITSPEDQATLRNPVDPVDVEVSLKPGLAEGHALVLYDNGEPREGMALDYPDRGTHTLQVKVENEYGDEVFSSEPVTIYVHRTSVLAP